MKNLIDVYILEDEPLAQKKMQAFIARVPQFYLKENFVDAQRAFEVLSKTSSQAVLFSDIEMVGMTGLQLVEALQGKEILVVLATAYEHYALQGYELNVVDYLLKPFSYDRFAQSVDKLLKRFAWSAVQPIQEVILQVKSENRIENIALSSIRYIEGMKDYVRIHTDQRKVMTLMTMTALLELLPRAQFVRTHRSYIVNRDKITSISSDAVAVMSDRIPIGRTYKEDALSKLKL